MNKLTKVKPSAKAGFTLVEVSVVMTIMAIMGVWAFGSYLGAKKQIYVEFVSNKLQSNIREVFINSISTKRESTTAGDCAEAAVKIKAVRIQLGVTNDPYDIISFCENTTGELTVGNIEAWEDPSEFLGYRQDVEVMAGYFGNIGDPWRYSRLLPGETGKFVYLIFTSPYGDYYTYVADGELEADYKCSDQSASAACAGNDPLAKKITDGTSWSRNHKTQSYSPASLDGYKKGYFQVVVDSNIDPEVEGITNHLNISEIGNAELNGQCKMDITKGCTYGE